MKASAFTILLFIFVTSTKSQESSSKKPEEKFSIHSLLRYTVRNNNVEEFLAIRYAKVGHNMEEASFSELNDSNSVELQHRFFHHGPPFCMQPRNAQIYYTDKDCLFLNIWIPRPSENKTFPVVVWLVGGLFKAGGSNLNKYKAHSFASKMNAILVVVQYRLGPSGFFYLNDEFAPGNNGLKDQILALKWINKYIEHFKGDRSNIVLIGDEAGAASVGYHLLSRKTSKLFKSAVMINGVPISEWAYLENQEAYERSVEVKERLRCDKDLDCMKNGISEEECLRDWDVVPEGEAIKIPFVPTRESKAVPDHPLSLLHRATHLRGKRIIIGNSKDAGTRFVNPSITYHDHFKSALLPTLLNNITLFQKFNAFYRNTSTVKYYHKILANIYTDRYFRCPADEFVRVARKHGATVYQYEMHSSGDEVGDELKYFLFDMENFKAPDWIILQKSGYQLAGFVEKGDPSARVNMDWGREVFFMGSRDGQANDRTQQCDFIKETLPDYLPDLGSGQGSLKSSVFNVFIVILLVVKALL